MDYPNSREERPQHTHTLDFYRCRPTSNDILVQPSKCQIIVKLSIIFTNMSQGLQNHPHCISNHILNHVFVDIAEMRHSCLTAGPCDVDEISDH